VTLVDTSVWIDHFRHGNPQLVTLLEANEVAVHPMVLGEIACGSLPDRNRTLLLLRSLQQVRPVSDGAVLHSIELHRWWNAGIGWVDAHLLSAALAESISLLTLDRTLTRLLSSMTGAS